MKALYSLVLALGVIVALQACKKNDNTPTPGDITNQNLLKAWKVSQVLEGSLDVTSAFSQYRLTLEETNGSKTFTLVKRDGTSLTGSWDISTDETTITLTATGNTITLSSVSISDSELKYTAEEQGKAGTVNVNFILIPA
ncbi:hypothetical protein BKI52_08555 [marine bacterium AO1-C]|nr:hypothetical protein BKI52_08555 [marine bacterium AO1-C]